MHRFSLFVAVLTTFLLFPVIGCGRSNPTTPTENPVLTGADHSSAGASGSAIWGIYDIAIDSRTKQADIVPERTAAFEANVTRFLQPPAYPINLLKVQLLSESDLVTGLVVCNITIKHPFPGTQFSGFDVKGIVMAPTGTACQWDPTLTYADSNSVQLLNADGWTRWWNQPEFITKNTIFGYTEGAMANHNFDSTTTLNPYKYFSDELKGDSPLTDITAAGRGFFSSENPGVNTRMYRLQFPAKGGVQFKFKYAISADWASPITGATSPWTPDDYPLEANQPEAFRLSISDEGSTAYFASPTIYGGDLNLVLHISDWQLLSGSTPGDEIETVIVESNNLFGVPAVINPTSATPGSDPETVDLSVNVPDVTPTGVSNQNLIVHVVSKHPTTYEPQIPGITGFVWPQNARLASELIFNVPIAGTAPNQPPVADASASNPLSGPAPLTVHLDPSLSHDPDGTIVLYEWDLDNDGTFDTSSPTPDIVDNQFPTPGQYQVNLRVTDNGGLSDTLDQPLVIDVQTGSTDEWNQLQNDPAHVGDISQESTLKPPLKELWHTQMASTFGPGIEGTPIIGGTFIMVLYSDAVSNWAEGFEYETGKSLWKTDLSPSGKTSYIGTQTGAYGDGRFYTPGDEVRALDPATGAVLWNYVPNKFETERHGLVYSNGEVMVHLSGDIHILDATDGSLVKTVPVGYGYANFQPFTLRDDIAYVQLDGAVRAYNMTTGVMVWNFSVDPPLFGIDSSVRCSPTVPGDGKVYFGCYNGYYYAVGQDNGGLVWKTPMDGGTQRSFDTCAWADGKIYYGEGIGNGVTIARLTCLDATTGGEVWAFDPPAGSTPNDGWEYSSPVVANGVVYAGHTKGKFAGCDAQTGGELWSFTAPMSASTDPVVVNGRLFFLSDDRTLWCFVNEN